MKNYFAKCKKKMKNYCLIVSLSATCAMSIASPVAPPDVQRLIPVGFSLVDYKPADLNADGREDALIVVEETNQTDAFAELPRVTMILLRNKNGELKTAEKNDKVYFCKKCLGSRDDHEQYLTVGKGTFAVGNHGGSPRYRWNQKFTFQYSIKNRKWMLAKVQTLISDDTVDGHNQSKVKILTYPKKLEKITFSQFKVNNNWIAKF
jgi:hypothetical protein